MTRIVISAKVCRPHRRHGVHRLAAALMVILLATAETGAAAAESPPSRRYEFVNIADNTGPLRYFIHGFPAINNSGTVAFEATFDDFGRGLFTSNGGPLRTIVDSHLGGPILAAGGEPIAINDAGIVAFVGDTADGIGIFTSTPDGSLRTIATGHTWAVGYPERPPVQRYPVLDAALSLDRSGNVAFLYHPSTGVHSIVAGNGGPLRTIVSTDGPLAGLGRPSMSAGAAVAFLAAPDSGPAGVYVVEQGTLRRVAGPWDQYGLTNVSGFAAISDRGDVSVIGDHMAVNNVGGVAFERFDPLDGIYTGQDPVADKVIEWGDPLFGSQVRGLTFFHGGLNDWGDVVFKYELADDRVGIAVARVVPEPGVLGLLALVAPTLMSRPWSTTGGPRRRRYGLWTAT